MPTPGTTTQLVGVTVLADTLDEPDETFTVNLTAPVNATIGDGQGVGTILDDDPPQAAAPAHSLKPAPMRRFYDALVDMQQRRAQRDIDRVIGDGTFKREPPER